MDASSWARDSVRRIRRDGYDGVVESSRPVYRKFLSQLDRVKPAGVPIYDRDWDLLVVVDACRLDLMRRVAPDYEFASDVESVRSLDSTTAFWMRKNFDDAYARERADTAYVCGNPFSDDLLDSADFGHLSEVWKRSWDDPGTVPPRAVTDEAIRVARESDHDRLIVHYMQPHCPFIPRPDLMDPKELDRFGNQRGRDVWERLRDSELELAELWDGYESNLRLALDDVSLLLENVDAERAVVTSDHGNAVGEWYTYGHPPNQPHDCLRMVPWIETTAADEGTLDPPEREWADVGLDREEQLGALGYV